MMHKGMVVAVMALALGVASGASAAQISYTDSVPLVTTNWFDCVTITQFDPSLGALTSIKLELKGHVEGTAQFESKDDAPATVTMDLQAFVRLRRPDNSVIVLTLPVASTSDLVTAYDDVEDFGGTSGKTYTGLSADDCETNTLTGAGDLALFTGLGGIDLPVTANGASTGSGAGNLVLQFATAAAADVKVTYFYDVPEPATLTLVGTGLVGAIGILRRRRMK